MYSSDTHSIDTHDITMRDIATTELAAVDGGFWKELGCGTLALLAQGATNNPAVGAGVFMDCYF